MLFKVKEAGICSSFPVVSIMFTLNKDGYKYFPRMPFNQRRTLNSENVFFAKTAVLSGWYWMAFYSLLSSVSTFLQPDPKSKSYALLTVTLSEVSLSLYMMPLGRYLINRPLVSLPYIFPSPSALTPLFFFVPTLSLPLPPSITLLHCCVLPTRWQ